MTLGAVQQRFAHYAQQARWAPSKHNAQPWRFVVRKDALDVWSDASRALPGTDPQGRELMISVGAAVQVVCVATRADGRLPVVLLFPDGVRGPVARVVDGGLHESTADDQALLLAVPLRRTDRGPLDADPLPAGLPFELQSAASRHGSVLRLVATPGDRSTLARLVERADRLLVRAGTADAELAPWLRDPGDERQDGVPSANSRGSAASYRAEFVQRDFSSPGVPAAQDRPGVDRPLVAVLCTPGDEAGDWVAAGRALIDVLLRATVAGAQASYLNQPLELPQLRAQLADDLRLPGSGQLVLRIGVGGAVATPPRRDDVVQHG